MKIKIKMLKFLLLHDKLYKTILKSLGVSLIFLLGLTWNFDFSKLSPLIKIEQTTIVPLRIQVSAIIFVIFLISFVYTNLSFSKKYKKYENLSEEEQKNYDSYFRTPSVYEKRGVLRL